MIRGIINSTIWGIVILCVSCNQPNKISTQAKVSTKKVVDTTKVLVKRDWIVQGDSIRLLANDHYVVFAKKDVRNYDSTYRGIYQIKGDSIQRSFFKVIDNTLYFTTFEDVGMGYRAYLHAYDLKQKVFLNDPLFNHHYIYSSAGVFFINNTNLISCVGKPSIYWEKKGILFTTVTFLRKSGSKFKYNKTVYEEGEWLSEDSSIISIYNKVVRDGGRRAPLLPDDWYKD